MCFFFFFNYYTEKAEGKSTIVGNDKYYYGIINVIWINIMLHIKYNTEDSFYESDNENDSSIIK